MSLEKFGNIVFFVHESFVNDFILDCRSAEQRLPAGVVIVGVYANGQLLQLGYNNPAAADSYNAAISNMLRHVASGTLPEGPKCKIFRVRKIADSFQQVYPANEQLS